MLSPHYQMTKHHLRSGREMLTRQMCLRSISTPSPTPSKICIRSTKDKHRCVFLSSLYVRRVTTSLRILTDTVRHSTHHLNNSHFVDKTDSSTAHLPRTPSRTRFSETRRRLTYRRPSCIKFHPLSTDSVFPASTTATRNRRTRRSSI